MKQHFLTVRGNWITCYSMNLKYSHDVESLVWSLSLFVLTKCIATVLSWFFVQEKIPAQVARRGGGGGGEKKKLLCLCLCIHTCARACLSSTKLQYCLTCFQNIWLIHESNGSKAMQCMVSSLVQYLLCDTFSGNWEKKNVDTLVRLSCCSPNWSSSGYLCFSL